MSVTLTEVTYVPIAALRNIKAHAMEFDGTEVCGLLGGHANVVRSLARVSNHAANPTNAFRIDPADQYKVEKSFERIAADCFLIGVYHSHPTKNATPSRSDLDMIPPQLLSFIYSAVDDEVKCWRGDVQVSIEARD